MSQQRRQKEARPNRHSAKAGRSRGVPAPELSEILEGKAAPLLLVLDGVQDPHNLGAILRTAEGAGVDAVIAPKERAVGVTETVRRISVGAADRVPFLQVTNLARTLDELKETLIQISIYCGIPAGVEAFRLVRQVLEEEGIEVEK